MLLFMDSFDHYSLGTMPEKYETTGSGNGQSISTGRFSTNCYRVSGTNIGSFYKRRRFTTTTPDTLIVGCAINFGSSHSTSEPIISLQESGSTHIDIRYNGANIRITRAGTTLGTSSTTLLNDTWYYIELKVFIDNAVGTAELRIDEAVDLTLTNQDTQNGGTGFIDTIQLGSTVGSIFGGFYQISWDDLVIMDTTGSTNNDYLGDVRVSAQFPNGNGTNSDFSGSDGNSTDNYLLVDETVPNGDTDYVQSNTIGHKDTYNIQDVSFTSGDIYGVQINRYGRKTDAGIREWASVARLSATEEDGPSENLSNTARYYLDIREERPGGGSWTVTDINNAEFGVKVTA